MTKDNWIKAEMIKIEPSVLNVCICGQHNNGYLPISQIHGASVLLHYVDRSGVIKVWDGDVQKQIKDAIEKTNKRWKEELLAWYPVSRKKSVPWHDEQNKYRRRLVKNIKRVSDLLEDK